MRTDKGRREDERCNALETKELDEELRNVEPTENYRSHGGSIVRPSRKKLKVSRALKGETTLMKPDRDGERRRE